ncbi:hypothetical protein Tco_0612224 [Tanacetum coccineum]
MVVESEVLNDFPRFVGVLIAEFAATDAVNFTHKMEENMIIEDLDSKPTIDAMMRDFLDPSRWKELSKETSSKIRGVIEPRQLASNSRLTQKIFDSTRF